MKVNKKPKENIYRILLDDKQQNQYSFETENEKTYDIMATATGRDNERQDRCESRWLACPDAGDARNASTTKPNAWGDNACEQGTLVHRRRFAYRGQHRGNWPFLVRWMFQCTAGEQSSATMALCVGWADREHLLKKNEDEVAANRVEVMYSNHGIEFVGGRAWRDAEKGKWPTIRWAKLACQVPIYHLA
ncbi:hypothetical protein B0H13DRAFT_1882987 [Mycena leptocephala]|nr:hypothetical protein B0H13DRAFT_1882987 [Mycena leptocephala]